jgi:formate dehydrogenase subunit delta
VSNTIDNIVRMVNQIAANLALDPDPAAATADHIRLFWDPRMKTMLRTFPPGLSDMAQRAVHLLN